MAWIAITLLATSYWFQIYKIHKHREVRDLSVPYYVFLILGYVILAHQAFVEDSSIFFWKQIATIVPVLIILYQIYVHRQDHWHDDSDPNCLQCNEDLEPGFIVCPWCGTVPTEEQKQQLNR